MEEAKISRLDNGMVVVTRRQDSDQTYVGLQISAGSRHESPGQEGLAHFTEHLLVKDTEEYTKQERQKKVRDMYGTMNAYTTYEKTHYYYHVNGNYVDQAIGLLADSVLRSKISPESVAREAGVIATEKMEGESNTHQGMFELMMKSAYPDSSLKPSVIGEYGSIRSITPEDVQSFRDRHYTADRMVFVAVGDVDHDHVCNMVSKKFEKVPLGDWRGARDFPPARYSGGCAIVDNDSLEQIDFRLAYPIDGKKAGLREYYKNYLVAQLLGGDPASPLFRSLRDKGIAYSPHAYVMPQHDTGLLIVDASFFSENAPTAIATIAEEVGNLSRNISEENLAGLKRLCIGRKERSENDPQRKADALASEILDYGGEITPQEQRRILDSISAHDLERHARMIFSRAPTIVAYGKNARALEHAIFQKAPSLPRGSCREEVSRGGDLIQARTHVRRPVLSR